MDRDLENAIATNTFQFENSFSSGPTRPPAVKKHARNPGSVKTATAPTSEVDFIFQKSTWRDVDMSGGLTPPFFSNRQENRSSQDLVLNSVINTESPIQFSSGYSNAIDPEPSNLNQPGRSPISRKRYLVMPSQGQAMQSTDLARELKGRHLQMIVIAGSIGTGLLVATGDSLVLGGPGSLLISFATVGLMMYCTCRALAELAVHFPTPGSFAIYFSRFIDPAWGFAVSWSYVLKWLLTLPLEAVAGTRVLSYWPHARDVNPAAWVTLFLVVVVSINLSGVRIFGETEFIFSLLKVAALVGFIIFGVVIDLGGEAQGQYVGARYWHNPGAFNPSYQYGLLSSFSSAAFAFSGTELIGICAAESEDPQNSVSKASRTAFWLWRIVVLFMLSLVIVTLLVPYNDPALLSNGNVSSPFTIALHNSGVAALPSIMNAIIFLAVLSAGSSSIYASSRVLAALAAHNQAPAFLASIDRSGKPRTAVMTASVFGLLGYFVTKPDISSTAFVWMLATCGMATLFTWASICLCHIRFRQAWKAQRSSTEISQPMSRVNALCSWIGLVLNLIVITAQPVGALWAAWSFPVPLRAGIWFMQCMSLPVIIITYLAYKIIMRTRIQKASTMDITSGRLECSHNAGL